MSNSGTGSVLQAPPSPFVRCCKRGNGTPPPRLWNAWATPPRVLERQGRGRKCKGKRVNAKMIDRRFWIPHLYHTGKTSVMNF